MSDVTIGLGTTPQSDLDYHALVAHVKATFDTNQTKLIFRATPGGKDFTPVQGEKAISANSVYLNSLPVAEQGSHNCFTCRDFFKHYADLVTINDDGSLCSAVWDPENAPVGYGDTVAALKARAESGRVTGRFFTETTLLGTAENGNPDKGSFEHFHLEATDDAMKAGVLGLGDTHHKANLLCELFSKSLGDFKPETIKWAIHQFTYDAELARRPSALHALNSFLTAQAFIKTIGLQSHRKNLLWLLSQTLPSGAATLTNTALGTYLARIQMAENDGVRNFARSSYLTMTSPETYKRASTETSEGQIAAAENLITKLGVAASFQRRAATLSDIQEWVWQHPEQTPETPVQAGVFDRLRKQVVQNPKSIVAGKRIGWDEFVRDILPNALTVHVKVPNNNHNFSRMVTAVDADAPPILIWDDVEQRNPVSWYIYHGGSPASAWGLIGGTYAKLTGITPLPSSWNGKTLPQWNPGHFLVLEGAIEKAEGSLGLFPEILIRDLYEARNAIDNLSKTTPLTRVEEGEFAGIIINQGLDTGSAYLNLLVELPTGIVSFDVVRWTE